GESMIRIHLRHARAKLHLAQPVVGPDGALVAGVGSALKRSVVRALADLGVRSVWVREVDEVREWEEDRDLPRALADLDARLAAEPPDPTLAAIAAALRRHRAARHEGAGSGASTPTAPGSAGKWSACASCRRCRTSSSASRRSSSDRTRTSRRRRA